MEERVEEGDPIGRIVVADSFHVTVAGAVVLERDELRPLPFVDVPSELPAGAAVPLSQPVDVPAAEVV
jgi:hypothetical protein